MIKKNERSESYRNKGVAKEEEEFGDRKEGTRETQLHYREVRQEPIIMYFRLSHPFSLSTMPTLEGRW